MKTLNLTKQQAHLLRMQMEQRAEGYSLGDLRKVDCVLSLIEGQCQEYESQLTAAISQHRDNHAMLGQCLDAINSDSGSTECVITIEDAHFEIVLKMWSEIKTWSGQKSARQLVLAIDYALRRAESP